MVKNIDKLGYKSMYSDKKQWLWFILYLGLIIIGQQLFGIAGLIGAIMISYGLFRTIRNEKYSLGKRILFSFLWIVGGMLVAFLLSAVILGVIEGLFPPSFDKAFGECREAYPGNDPGNLFQKDTCIFNVVYNNNGTLDSCKSLIDIHELNECKIAAAALGKDYSLCDQMVNDIMRDENKTSYKDLCLEVVAFEFRDVTKCNSIISEELKSVCKINIQKDLAGEEITPYKVWRNLININGTLKADEYVGQGFQLYNATNVSINFDSNSPVYTCIANDIELNNYKNGKQYSCVGGSINETTVHEDLIGYLDAGSYTYLFYSPDSSLSVDYSLNIDVLE